MKEQQAVSLDRDRIARDLHDRVIQRLFAAGLSMQSLRRYTDDPIALERLSMVTVELDKTIQELRATIYSLQVGSHDPDTMSSKILTAIKEASGGLEFSPHVRFSGPIDARLGDMLSDNLLAVISEGLSNIVRHSGATSVEITVGVDRGRVRLVMRDDGRGFRYPSRRSGLENLRQRAKLCHGRFDVRSVPGEGTRLLWSAPIPADASPAEPPGADSGLSSRRRLPLWGGTERQADRLEAGAVDRRRR
jgi:signal transduction histidine kinase